MEIRGRAPGPQLTKSSLITSIPHYHRQIICARLDVYDNWKKFVGFIKSRDGVTPRYSDLQMCLFDQVKERRHGSPTDSILSDWKTLRPTIGDFVDILKTVNLMATANYIHSDVLQLGPLKEPSETDEGPVCSTTGYYQPQESLTPVRSFAVGDPYQRSDHFREYPSILDNETEESLKEYMTTQPKPIPFYHYNDLEFFTDGFNRDHLDDGGRFLGKGGYGEVYLGKIKTADKVELVAVKRFNESSLEYLKQFKTELEVIFLNCHHPNLLAIKGICKEKCFCVIYEYMGNGTLEQCLVPDAEKGVLSSAQRISIAIDVARGIQRLHTGSANPIVHRDIKPANILLGDTLSAKVGDYGLVRVQTMKDNSHTNMTVDVHGSKFYMPPEANTGVVSPKWDVYSFGVVLLELLFAKGPQHTDEDGFCEKMIEYIFDDEFEGDPLDLLDPSCDWDRSIASQLIGLVSRCSLKWRKRPNICGDQNSVLETLLQIQSESNRKSLC